MEPKDEEHLRLLTTCHYVLAGLKVVFGFLPFLHLGIGLFLLLAPTKDGPPPVAGIVFIVLAVFLIVTSWTVAVLAFLAGRNLAKRTRHTFCLIVAGVCCVFPPLGTALGIFSFIVLSRPSVQALFTSGA